MGIDNNLNPALFKKKVKPERCLASIVILPPFRIFTYSSEWKKKIIYGGIKNFLF